MAAVFARPQLINNGLFSLHSSYTDLDRPWLPTANSQSSPVMMRRDIAAISFINNWTLIPIQNTSIDFGMSVTVTVVPVGPLEINT